MHVEMNFHCPDSYLEFVFTNNRSSKGSFNGTARPSYTDRTNIQVRCGEILDPHDAFHGLLSYACNVSVERALWLLNKAVELSC